MSTKKLGRLGRLTRGERLLIHRRRLGETQGEAAKKFGITRFRYGAWERDEIDGPARNIGRPKPYERCLLYRRRIGYTQVRVAKAIKRSRWWVNQMERGEVPCAELLRYWEG